MRRKMLRSFVLHSAVAFFAAIFMTPADAHGTDLGEARKLPFLSR